MTRTILFLAIALAESAIATIHFVPDDFAGLQEALDGSGSNDTVVCRPGTYFGSFEIPPISITLASEYLFSTDTSLISSTVIRPSEIDPEQRCLTADSAFTSDTTLRIIGLTVTLGRATGTDTSRHGGGLFVKERFVELRDCIFSFCHARYGGAIYADNSKVNLGRCTFYENDAANNGRLLRGRQSEIEFNQCDIGANGSVFDGFGSPVEISMFSGELDFRFSRIHDVGQAGGLHDFIGHSTTGAPPRHVRMHGCQFENNRFTRLYQASGSATPELVVDSCIFLDNVIGFGLFLGWSYSGMIRAEFTRNWFEHNYRIPPYGSQGLLVFDTTPTYYVVEDNYFDSNEGFFFACISINEGGNPYRGRVWRNHFVNNRSETQPAGGSKTLVMSRVAANAVEYNSFVGNIGNAVHSGEGVSCYALHNFWGDSTGPYEATRNPDGLGDSTNSATVYEPWLGSEDDIPDTTILPNPVEEWSWPVPSTWYVSNVYPNPFNSKFRVELDGMTGPDFEIRLFDLLGREVALLYSGRTLRGTLIFDAPNGLAAGVYFLRAKDHLYAETKKVLYLK